VRTSLHVVSSGKGRARGVENDEVVNICPFDKHFRSKIYLRRGIRFSFDYKQNSFEIIVVISVILCKQTIDLSSRKTIKLSKSGLMAITNKIRHSEIGKGQCCRNFSEIETELHFVKIGKIRFARNRRSAGTNAFTTSNFRRPLLR
jgi:hypothetical protein